MMTLSSKASIQFLSHTNFLGPSTSSQNPFSFHSTKKRNPKKIDISSFHLRKVNSSRNKFKQFAESDNAIQVDTLPPNDDSFIAAEECELVLGKELEIGNNSEGIVNAHLSEAVKNRNGASVLLLTDVYGYRNPDTRDFAYRLACFGYSVLVPDLFRDYPWKSTRPQAMYEDWRSQHPSEQVISDINTSIKYLSSTVIQKDLAPGLGRVAVLGFCFGGGRLIEVLANKAYDFSTGVMFYGTRFDPNLAANINVPLLLVTGDSDPQCSVETMQKVADEVAGSKLLVYEGCGHAFAHHPKTLEDDEAAESAFIALRQWLQTHLLNDIESS